MVCGYCDKSYSSLVYLKYKYKANRRQNGDKLCLLLQLGGECHFITDPSIEMTEQPGEVSWGGQGRTGAPLSRVNTVELATRPACRGGTLVTVTCYQHNTQLTSLTLSRLSRHQHQLWPGLQCCVYFVRTKTSSSASWQISTSPVICT